MAICPQVIKRPTVTGNCLTNGGGGGFGSSSVATVADMTALDVSTLTDNQIIFTAGYYEAGDTGGAQYRYVSAAVDNVDHGSVHAPDIGPGRFVLLHNGWFTTKEFGCKGDATPRWLRNVGVFSTPTDDTVQMQAAFDYATASGATCLVMPGIYRITSMLLISKGWATNIVGAIPFDYPGLRLGPPNWEMVDGFQQCTLANDSATQSLITIRGVLNYNGANGGSIDGDIKNYTVGTGYRNSGTIISDVQFATRISKGGTVPMVIMKRLARCTFERVGFFQAPYQGLEATSIDDSIFDRCYFYVCGNTGKTYACTLRRGRTIHLESDYLYTNTLAFRNCDFEGNFYGNLNTANLASLDNGQVISLTMTDCVGKAVTVLDSGRNCFDFYACNPMRFVCTAAMGSLSAVPVTATELVRFTNCSLVTLDVALGLLAGGTNENLHVNRGITLIDCQAVLGRLTFICASAGTVPSDEYMVNAAVGPLSNYPKQIHIETVLSFNNSGALGKKGCNVIGTPQNSASDTLLGEIIGANFNSTADQQIVIRSPVTTVGTNKPFYKITQILVCGSTVSMTTAVGGIYTGPGKTGVHVVEDTQVYAALVSNIKNIDLTLNDTDIRTETPLYFSLTTPQGVAATADIRIYGRPLAS